MLLKNNRFNLTNAQSDSFYFKQSFCGYRTQYDASPTQFSSIVLSTMLYYRSFLQSYSVRCSTNAVFFNRNQYDAPPTQFSPIVISTMLHQRSFLQSYSVRCVFLIICLYNFIVVSFFSINYQSTSTLPNRMQWLT